MWDRVRCLLVCQFVSVFVSVPADQRVSLYNVFVFGLFIAQAQTHRHIPFLYLPFSLPFLQSLSQPVSQLFVWLHRS